MKIALSAVAVALSTTAASAAPLFYENFDSYALGTPGNISAKWNVTEGSVDVIGAPGPYNWYPTQQIDMNGSGGPSTAAAIITNAAITGFVIGKQYALSFDYGSNKNSNENEKLIYKLFLGSNVAVSGSVGSNGSVDTMILHTVNFIAKSTSYFLSFRDAQAGKPYGDDDSQGGPIIDNVMVAAVPVPAAGLMLLAGLGGLAALRRRKALV